MKAVKSTHLFDGEYFANWKMIYTVQHNIAPTFTGEDLQQLLPLQNQDTRKDESTAGDHKYTVEKE